MRWGQTFARSFHRDPPEDFQKTQSNIIRKKCCQLGESVFANQIRLSFSVAIDLKGENIETRIQRKERIMDKRNEIRVSSVLTIVPRVMSTALLGLLFSLPAGRASAQVTCLDCPAGA